MVEAVDRVPTHVTGAAAVRDYAVRDTTDRMHALDRGRAIADLLVDRRLISILAAVAASFLVVAVMLHYREPLARLGSWGYLGAFLAESANSALILVPTASSAYTFAMGVSLNPFLLGLIGGIGAGLGELTGYLLGSRGRVILEDGPLAARLRRVTNRWMGPAIVAAALLPVPFDVAGLWAGASRYPVLRFLLLVTTCKVIKMTVVALAGYYSITGLIGS